jgi:5-methylcytosine-specific restriction endonuclease McrA
MSNYVFVLDTGKQPLTPCKPSVARRLLNAGKAAVYSMYPFTIVLKKEVILDTELEPIELKLDPGSRTTGIALVQGSKVIFGAELTHRGQSISNALTSRRQSRRSRRNRHTRYRQPRFLNRKKSPGWLAPSLTHRVLTTLTWVKKFIRLAPIKSITQELVRFDLQHLENPEISGIEYSQGTLVGYSVREYLLNKWNRKCTYCGSDNLPLQIEHIHPKSKGGSNRISNLCLACEPCNTKKGAKSITQFLAKQPLLLTQIQSQAKQPLKDAAAVNSTRWYLFNSLKALGLSISTGSGGQTKYNRTKLGLSKEHWLDAACVGQVPKLEALTTQPLLITARGQGSRQRCRTDKYGFPSRYRPKNPFVYGFQTGDIVKARFKQGLESIIYVGRVAIRSSGNFNISTNSKLIQGISYRLCRLIHKKDGYSYGFNSKSSPTIKVMYNCQPIPKGLKL